jgi:hypothetical protein
MVSTYSDFAMNGLFMESRECDCITQDHYEEIAGSQ